MKNIFKDSGEIFIGNIRDKDPIEKAQLLVYNGTNKLDAINKYLMNEHSILTDNNIRNLIYNMG